MTPTLSFKQRAILKAWPNWVDDLRGQGYRVATRAKAEYLTLPFDPDAAYMYKTFGRKRPGESADSHFEVHYYRFTEKRAPERFGKEVWK